MDEQKVTYEWLYNKSIELEELLVKKGLIQIPARGRLKEYQKEIVVLAEKWKRKHDLGIDEKVDFGGTQVFALKEIRELIEVLLPILGVYEPMPEVCKKILREKINFILSGVTYIFDEKANTVARNYLFELRLAAKFIESGYTIYFYDNPDIAVEISGRRYAIECKRITGNSERAVKANIEEAVGQLLREDKRYYAGIVALDVSALFDNRISILVGNEKEKMLSRLLDNLGEKLKIDYKKTPKLRKGHVVGLLYNYSGSYATHLDNDVGWMQSTGIMVLDKEHPNKAARFESDFKKYKNMIVAQTFI